MGRPFDPDFAALRSIDPRQDELILDVGSNYGLAIGAIRLYRPSAPVVGFEPNRRLADGLRRRFASDRSTTVYDVGLDAEEADRTLYLPLYRGYAFYGLASMIRSEAEGWLSNETIAAYDARWLEIEEIPCRVRPLDALSLRPTFMKLDVQGIEDRVLTGARKTIEASRPVIMIENGASVPRCERMLGPLGYEIKALGQHGWTDDLRSRMNVFFLPGERHFGRRSNA